MPYGETEVSIAIDVENLKEVIKPREDENSSIYEKRPDESSEGQIELKGLCKLVDKNDSISICVDCQDGLEAHLFPISTIVEELCRVGVKEERINILLATGANGGLSKEMALESVGHLSRKIEVLSHDCNSSDLTHVGSTSFGNKVYLNKRLMDSSFKILLGRVRPHYIAGYSGAESVILPGLAGIETILFNLKMSLQKESKSGKLEGNPVYEDAREAMEFAQADYAVNIIFDNNMNFAEVFMGSVKNVLSKSVPYIENMCKIKIDGPADVIVASPGGGIFDNNFYKACDVFHNLNEILTEDVFLILISECLNGYGNPAFYELMQRFRNVSDRKRMEKEIKAHFKPGYEKAYYLSEITRKVKVSLVSVLPNYSVKSVFGLKSAETGNEAFRMASRFVGKDFNTVVIPYGSLTIPILKQ